MYIVLQINGQSKKFAGNHGNHKRSVPFIPPYHLSLTFMGIENKHFVPVTFTVKCGMDATQLLNMIHGFKHFLLCALICYTRDITTIILTHPLTVIKSLLS